MEETPEGTPVGVDDPYAVAGLCDHLTDDGRCRFALDHAGVDPEFASERAADDYACHVGDTDDWQACPHYRWTTTADECRRCGLENVRLAHDDSQPLIEEHHLSYGGDNSRGSGDSSGGTNRDSDVIDADSEATDGDEPQHELTVALCRWCHAKVHQSFARIDDAVDPDPEAIAEREQRVAAEQSELGFQSARDRREE
ncbi:MAG: hypothetical protein ABEH61_02860 [Haloarculaceae archaeon]